MTGLSWAGRAGERPGNLAVRGVQGIQVAPHARAAAILGSDQHEPAFVGRPRGASAVGGRVLAGRADLVLPGQRPGLLAKRDDVLAAERGEDPAASDGNAAFLAGEAGLVLPDHLAGRAVD